MPQSCSWPLGFVVTEPAHADVCGYADDPFIGVSTIGDDVEGAAVVAEAADAAAQAALATPRDGVPYYTPGDAPCF